jgi:type II secretory pathway pseudopilin PulG
MNKGKLVLPISILLGCIILGGFYYASEANKQRSIEMQQQLNLDQQQATLDQQSSHNNLIVSEKSDCAKQARETTASEYRGKNCHDSGGVTINGYYLPDSADCSNGTYPSTTYYISAYNNAYNTCLESKGLK